MRDSYREGKGERLSNACKDNSVSMINAVSRFEDSSGRTFNKSTRKSELDSFLDGFLGSRKGSRTVACKSPARRATPVQLMQGLSILSEISSPSSIGEKRLKVNEDLSPAA